MTASPSRSHSPARASAFLLAALLAGGMLAACTAGPAVPSESVAPSASAPSDAATEPSDGPSTTQAPDADDARAENLADAMASGNTAAIEAYLTDPTRVVIAASEADMLQDPVDAVLSIDYVQPGVGAWDFALEESVLASYAASTYYAQFFPADAIVGLSESGAVISFLPVGELVGTIFMAIDESLLLDP
jgi:hypothetical protein